MRLVLTLWLLLICFVGCSTQSKYIKDSSLSDGSDVIELVNPYQDDLDRELSSTQKMSAHTVYDSDDKITEFKENKTNQIVEGLAGPYKFYKVTKRTTLGNISKELYGSAKNWKNLYRWNLDVLGGIGTVESGTKLKYLPSKVAKSTPQKATTRMPASTGNEFEIYVVKANDNMGYIAEKLYGDRKMWKQLRDWNRDTLPDPSKLEKGIQLRYRVPAGKK